MKRKLSISFVALFCMAILSCGSKKETAASIAQQWCNLNAKVHKASDESAKDAAKMARKNFEKEIEAKYKENKAFMDEVKKEAEKCEAASEGR